MMRVRLGRFGRGIEVAEYWLARLHLQELTALRSEPSLIPEAAPFPTPRLRAWRSDSQWARGVCGLPRIRTHPTAFF